MPVAIFIVAFLGALAGFALALCLGSGIVAAIALTPVSGSIAAVGLCMFVVGRPSVAEKTPVPGSNSEPECIPAP